MDGLGDYTSIAIDTSDKVHIGYHYDTEAGIKYVTNASGSWVTETVDSSDLVWITSIAIDTSDKVHISHINLFDQDLKYTTNASGLWITETLDSSGSVGGTSIAIGTSDKVHISHYDVTNENLKYTTNASGSWVTETVDSSGVVGIDAAIALDSLDKVHISYRDYTTSYSYPFDDRDLKYATDASGSWVTETVDFIANVQDTSIALDTSDKIHISYYDSTNGDLKYATNATGSWVTETVDSEGYVGRYTSIAIDSSGNVHISYHDSTNGDLKYATTQVEVETNPVPNIKANNSDGPVIINTGDNLSVTVELDSGDSTGENADWWVYVTSPFGTYWYTLNSGWQPSNTPIRVYGGPLFNLTPFTILDMSTLPVGDYHFNFSVDDNMDNIQDNTYANSVLVTIETGGTGGYNLPDTGQWQNYTNVFGEDSDYTINPPSYTDNGDETVTDNHTGLMWQQEDDNNTYIWSDAVSYCENLSLAGNNDWRLPEVKGLTDIVNYGTYNPAIDEIYFPNTKSDSLFAYWSSTLGVFADEAWIVEFHSGNVGFPCSEPPCSSYVRCVRSGQNTANFTNNGNETVTDNVTGLMWQQQDDNTERIWESAITYCEGLSLTGYSDWRLPNIKELKSIVDYDKSSPAIDEIYFPNTNYGYQPQTVYWSSSTYVFDSFNTMAWVVDFGGGSVYTYYDKSSPGYARCVRGGE